MQLGTENRNKTMVAVGLMVVAVVFAVVRFIPDSPASAKTPTPAVTPQAATHRQRRSGRPERNLLARQRVRSIQPFVTTG